MPRATGMCPSGIIKTETLISQLCPRAAAAPSSRAITTSAWLTLWLCPRGESLALWKQRREKEDGICSRSQTEFQETKGEEKKEKEMKERFNGLAHYFSIDRDAMPQLTPRVNSSSFLPFFTCYRLSTPSLFQIDSMQCFPQTR